MDFLLKGVKLSEQQGMQMGMWKIFSFEQILNAPGFFLSTLETTMAGDLQIEASCKSAKRNIQAKLQVEESNREKLGKPTNPVQLEQLAKLTTGLSVNYQEANQLISALSLIPEPQPITRIHSLRSNLYWEVFSLFYWLFTGRVENSLGWSSFDE